MKLIFFMVSVFFFVTSAWSSPSDEAKEIQAKYVEKLSDKKFDAIRQKFPLMPNSNTTLQMLTDTSKVNDRERKALESYQVWGKEYIDSIIPLMNQYSPTQTKNIEWHYQSALELLANLYSRKMSWGEFNKQWSELRSEYKKRIYETASQNKVDAENSKRVEIENKNRQDALNQIKKNEYCQNLIRGMQINCPKQLQGTGNPALDMQNSISNFNPAGSFECGRLQGEFNSNCH